MHKEISIDEDVYELSKNKIINILRGYILYGSLQKKKKKERNKNRTTLRRKVQCALTPLAVRGYTLNIHKSNVFFAFVLVTLLVVV